MPKSRITINQFPPKAKANKTKKKMKQLLVLALVFLFLISGAYSQDVISWLVGRYAITSDGNQHDPDDIGA